MEESKVICKHNKVEISEVDGNIACCRCNNVIEIDPFMISDIY